MQPEFLKPQTITKITDKKNSGLISPHRFTHRHCSTTHYATTPIILQYNYSYRVYRASYFLVRIPYSPYRYLVLYQLSPPGTTRYSSIITRIRPTVSSKRIINKNSDLCIRITNYPSHAASATGATLCTCHHEVAARQEGDMTSHEECRCPKTNSHPPHSPRTKPETKE